jgi:hypothetical protein
VVAQGLAPTLVAELKRTPRRDPRRAGRLDPPRPVGELSHVLPRVADPDHLRSAFVSRARGAEAVGGLEHVAGSDSSSAARERFDRSGTRRLPRPPTTGVGTKEDASYAGPAVDGRKPGPNEGVEPSLMLGPVWARRALARRRIPYPAVAQETPEDRSAIQLEEHRKQQSVDSPDSPDGPPSLSCWFRRHCWQRLPSLRSLKRRAAERSSPGGNLLSSLDRPNPTLRACVDHLPWS